MNKKLLRLFFGVLVAVLGLTAVSFAQTEEKVDISKVKIKNFGQMDKRFFRGGQPKERQFKQLAALGINTVINLRDGAKSFEKEAVESLGMRYIHIPMDDNKYPSEESVQKFLDVIDDSATGKFFVHCRGGRHRAGAMGAVYRFNKYGWDFDRVFKEMKDFKFFTFFGKFKVIKRFVRDYGEKMNTEKNAASVSAVNGTK